MIQDTFGRAFKQLMRRSLNFTDLNPGPTESKSCLQAVLRGGWLDAAAAANNLAATHFLPHGSPRRLDAIFLHKAAAVCFRKYHVHDARSPFASSGCFFGCLPSVSLCPVAKTQSFASFGLPNRVLLRGKNQFVALAGTVASDWSRCLHFLFFGG